MFLTSKTKAQRRRTQSGFTMIELMVALMIIAVIATLGIKQYSKYSAEARYIKAQDTLRVVKDGLDFYFLKHGTYPELTSFEAMVDGNSPLVKENLIPVNVASKDPWKQPFEGTSSKGKFTLQCLGDPTNQEEHPPFTVEPGKISGDPTRDTTGGAAAPAGPAKGTP